MTAQRRVVVLADDAFTGVRAGATEMDDGAQGGFVERRSRDFCLDLASPAAQR
jgi:hypothetical protein